MTRKIQTSYTKYRNRRGVCLGDSITSNYVWGVGQHQFYPRRFQEAVNAAGGACLMRNFGVSGEATGQMISRMALLTQYETPDLAVLYGGINDLSTNGTTLVTAATVASTTQFSVTAASGVRFPAGSYITLNGQTRLISARSTDLLTVTPALSGAPTLGDTVNCATRQNLVVIGQFLQAAGCTRIIIVGRHFDNFSTGGETPLSPATNSQTLRALQSGAATDLGAVYCDLFAYMAARITNGTDVQGSFSWHVFDSNIHLNAYGEQIVANALLATVQSQTGWLAALS